MQSAEKKAGSNAVLKPLGMGVVLCLGLLAGGGATDVLA